MKRYNKTISAGLGLILFFLLLAPCRLPLGAEELQRHRFVVLVYDDSGSMSANQSSSWEKANYSLQSLAAVLDSADRLYVVRMSAPGLPVEIPLASAARQQAINSIRNTPNAGGNTPIEAITTASNLLGGTSETYDRWLVISSDGQFQTAENQNANGTDFARLLDNFRNSGNNSSINLIFMAMGNQVSDDLKAAWLKTTGQAPLEARTADEIIARMDEVSALITSRDPDHPGESRLPLQIENSNTIVIQSPFPLRRLTILRQAGTDALVELSSFQVNGSYVDSSLHISGPFVVGTPPGGSEGLAGRLLQIDMGSSVIPEGTYKLVFKQNIASDMQHLTFLAETAIDFTCNLLKGAGGNQVQVDNANAVIGELVQARVQILRAPGSQPLSIKEIADQVEVVADIGQQRGIRLQPDPASNSFIADGIKLEKGKMDAKFTMTVRGWYKGTKHLLFEVKQEPPRNIGLIVEPNQWQAQLDDLESGPLLKLIPTVDGRPMSESEFAEIKDNLKIQGSLLRIDVQPGTNSFTLRPQSSIWRAPFIPSGDQTIKAELQGRISGEKASTIVKLTIEDVPWHRKYGPALAWIVFTLLGLWYLWGLYKKPRFVKGSMIGYIQDDGANNLDPDDARGQVLENHWFKRYLVPYSPERTEIGSATFIATRTAAKVKIGRESLDRVLQQEEMQVSLAGNSVKREFLNVDMDMGSGQEMRIQRPNYREWFKYEP